MLDTTKSPYPIIENAILANLSTDKIGSSKVSEMRMFVHYVAYLCDLSANKDLTKITQVLKKSVINN